MFLLPLPLAFAERNRQSVRRADAVRHESRPLVEAAQNRPDEQRFELVVSDQGALVSHPGLPNGELRVNPSDIETLVKKGLVIRFGLGAIEAFRLVQIPRN